ncbi:VCBS repeat-containing protein [Clostridium sp. DJ247]|uniref:FG-GAP repeat domain-containing protein n=1 Tax=Clostridium sp. DJ247 TaxID=2726188 RepID=UPI00162737C0|nr:VCBS repeat-containing protein [Clostridium sp. DJ247]MBC2579811.1 VCBS repeat-containing protein [Clostridium sp. DJ247]
MKFRVIFLKKKYIYFVLLTFILIILLVILQLSKRYSSTFNNVSENKIIKADFNGDGKDDTLYVRRNNDKYDLAVKIKDRNFPINADKSSPPIGPYSSYWPMRITLMDVSRDKIPEIFIQSSSKDNSLQHIFIWNDGKFENIFSNSNNILGFIDCKNNKTPKVISGKLQNDTMWLSNYIFLNYKFKNYNYNSTNTFMGKDSICSFIKFIQGLPHSEEYKPTDIFSPNISSKNLSIIGKLSGENNTYSFQDALFMENKCNENGDVTEVLWTLNFRGISNTDKNIVKNYVLNLLLTPDENTKDNYYFKISSISLK